MAESLLCLVDVLEHHMSAHDATVCKSSDLAAWRGLNYPSTCPSAQVASDLMQMAEWEKEPITPIIEPLEP